LELHQLLVVEGSVNRRDEEVPLAKDGDKHADGRADPCSGLFGAGHAEPELALGLLDPSLEVADGVHLGQVDTESVG
jgi:hypothetical protein